MSDDIHDDYLDTQWTDEAKERFLDASRRLVEAIQTHADAVVDPRTRSEGQWWSDASDSLRNAAIAYADAQVDYADFGDPFGILEIWDDEEDEGSDEAPEPITTISVLYRADYAVTDEAAVEYAGNEVFRDADPEHAATVSGLGGSLYQIAHLRGIESLHEVPGLMPLGAVTQIIEPDEVLEFDDALFSVTEPNPAFAAQGSVLFTSEDRWAI